MTKYKQIAGIILYFLVHVACQAGEEVGIYYSFDPHSFSRPNDAVVEHLEWHARIDFDTRLIHATATWHIKKQEGMREIIFDTDDLDITKVWLDNNDAPIWRKADAKKYLGSALVVNINAETQKVYIIYSSSKEAKALQWLAKDQTQAGRAPFLFTQGQAILTRSWLPCQDSPGIRFSFDAQVQVPKGMMALMSACNPHEVEDNGLYRFSNDKPIPAYLFALAVGEISFKPLNDRSGVYAEPEMIEKAWWEFAELPGMLNAAEDLFGPYLWDRYDVLVLPPVFPFGGMENPMLMFATPTIITGDRSLTNLVAHELSHSWSGNLVTNASWNDFWVNEGLTTFIERRIIERIKGSDYVEMVTALGNQELINTMDLLEDEKELTKLKLSLDDRNPDLALNSIPYQKGFALLQHIEQEVGKARMGEFVQQNFQAHAFSCMTTEDFVTYLRENLLNEEQMERLNIMEWIYEPGMPEGFVPQSSRKFDLVDAEIASFEKGAHPLSLASAGWSTFEWIYFFRSIASFATKGQLSALDEAFHFTQSGNAELLTAWFQLGIMKNHTAVYPAVEVFVRYVGRRKLLLPIYRSLLSNTHSEAMGRAWYEENRLYYHPVSRNTLDELVSIK